MWNFDISWWMFGKKLKLKISINGHLHPNILLYREIGTHMNKLFNNWSMFSLCNNLVTNVIIVQKDYERLNLMVFYP